MAVSSRILVVDDEQDTLIYLKHFMSSEGHEVVTTSRGSEGVELFSHQNFDLVFLDRHLRGEDGIEVMQQLRRVNDKVPIIIITGDGTVASAVEITVRSVHGEGSCFEIRLLCDHDPGAVGPRVRSQVAQQTLALAP